MKKIIGWIIILALVVWGVWYFVSSSPKTPAQESAQVSTPTNIAVGEPNPALGPKTLTVNYDGTTFNPNTVTIHAEDTVTFTNNSPKPMWIASGVHPAHTLYDSTDRAVHCATGYKGPAPFDECKASTSTYSFTFTRAGTWPFHDHTNASATGKIIVE